MDEGELAEFVAALIEQDAIAGAPEVFVPNTIWGFDHGEAVSVLGILREPPQLRLTTGCAYDIEMTGDLALALSEINAQLWNGRCYVNGNEQTNRGVVKFQDIVFGESLSWEHRPAILAAVRDLNTQINKARAVGPDLIGRFGGRPPAPGEMGVLLE